MLVKVVMSGGEKQNQNQLAIWVHHSIERVFSCFSRCLGRRWCCRLSCIGCCCCRSCCCLLVWLLCWLLTIASWRGQMLQLFDFLRSLIPNYNCATYTILIDLICSFPIRHQYFNRRVPLSDFLALHMTYTVDISQLPLFYPFNYPSHKWFLLLSKHRAYWLLCWFFNWFLCWFLHRFQCGAFG